MLCIILVPQRNQFIAQLNKCALKHDLGHLNNKAAGSQPLVFLQKQNLGVEADFGLLIWVWELFSSFNSVYCSGCILSSEDMGCPWVPRRCCQPPCFGSADEVTELLTDGFPITHLSWRDTESTKLTSQGHLAAKSRIFQKNTFVLQCSFKCFWKMVAEH